MRKIQPSQPTWETAERVYEYMIAQHAAKSTQRANAVDADPPSWGTNIDDWNWNPGVGIHQYFGSLLLPRPRPIISDYLVNWSAQ